MPRKSLRLAATKGALKQISSSARADRENETFEITSDDDVISVDMPPKKKYRLSHRKSSDGNDRDVIVLKTINSEQTLKLDVWPEELEPAQIAYREKVENELQQLTDKLKQITNHRSAKILFHGETCGAYEVDRTALPALTYFTQEPTKNKKGMQNTHSGVVLQPTKSKGSQNAYQLVVNPRLGLIVTSSSGAGISQPSVQNKIPTVASLQTRPKRRTRVRNVTQTPPTLTKIAKPSQPLVPFRPTESSSVGGLSTGLGISIQKTPASNSNTYVDLTTEDSRPEDDSREISFNKLQGKTFPSLVVVARPHLTITDVSGGDRAKLDSKVKSVLMHIPTKFTEWLIQQGLIRSEQTCSNHLASRLKLGMYSDTTKFPYSGGYVWISECCPHRFVSVFSGSLFEGSPHPPSVVLKLIYHWACQTNVQNVVQWVKVDNLYVKGMNTWLRAICTVALHTHVGLLGGPGRRVEVGVISLGTTSQDGQQRQVKVEVLGLLETDAKLIRLRAVEPLADGDRNYKKRFSKILEPLAHWVHSESIIVTDLTVDKGTLIGMGFKNIQQSTSNEHPNNHTIMEYLRRIVPRMFQNTLSLLSRQIIQQFLDELVWREWYGASASQAFDNILLHISEQTRADTGQSLTLRLNKVSANPFKNWSFQLSTQHISGMIKYPIQEGSSTAAIPVAPQKRYGVKSTKKIINARILTPPVAPVIESSQRVNRQTSPDVPEQLVPLENYYYGTIEGQADHSNLKVVWSIKCSMCKSHFHNNLKLMGHLFSHAHNIIGSVQQCRYCLSSVGSQEGLAKHITTSHPSETRFQDMYICVICETKFPNSFALGRHLSKEHVPSELPYQCSTCHFRCSSHKQVVDHFYNVHDGGSTIQCPFCLKSTTIWSAGRVLSQNLNHFMQHLQKHQKKAMAKKCPKCALWFIHRDTLKDHRLNMHISQKCKAGLVPWPLPKSCIMVPKSKQDKQIWDNIQKITSFTNLAINVPAGISGRLVCKECKLNINALKHYQAMDSCSNMNCQYSTCCRNAMKSHEQMCKDLNDSLPISTLLQEMHCVCGYSDNDGNMLAKHLAECERKSAYPSANAARAAIKPHSMLDVLGLVRRPEEPPVSIIDITEPVVEESSERKVENKNTKRKRNREKLEHRKDTIVIAESEVIKTEESVKVETEEEEGERLKKRRRKEKEEEETATSDVCEKTGETVITDEQSKPDDGAVEKND